MELLDAREKFRSGAITKEALTGIEDRLIRDVIAKQEATGIESITDGDFRRQSWSGDFITAIGGVRMEAAGLTRAQENAPKGTVVPDWVPPQPKTFAKMEHPAGGIQVNSYRFLKSVTKKTAKVTIPSPSMLHFRGGRGGVDSAAYPDMEKFFEDLTGVYKAEVQALAAAGCRYLQLDDTNLAYLCDPKLARAREEPGRRSGQAAGALCPSHQRRDRGPSRRHAHYRAPVPRQFAEPGTCGRRLRAGRRRHVQPAQDRRFLPGIR